MKCKDCEYFKIREISSPNDKYEMYKFGIAECTKYNFIVGIDTYDKLRKKNCVDEKPICEIRIQHFAITGRILSCDKCAIKDGCKGSDTE